MGLQPYDKKRDFKKTAEPRGRVHKPRKSGGLLFIIQKHDARRLHYDFRLELEGVLKSWAVPKGPSLDPHDRRFAVQVEDHPMEYGGFEGIIPKGEYGGGTVMLWDRGTWEPYDSDPVAAYKNGSLHFRLHGEKLRGNWVLARMKRQADDDKINWLLIKKKDEEARADGQRFLEEEAQSVATGRDLNEIAEEADQVWESNRATKKSVKTIKSKISPAPGRKKHAGLTTHPKIELEPSKLPGAKKAAMPDKVSVELATLCDSIPNGGDWAHEIKFDGYRIVTRIENGKVRMFSRNQLDWTAKFGVLPEKLANFPVEQAIFDGEMTFVKESGVTDFQKLVDAINNGKSDKITYYVFDLLYLNGYDMRRVPLLKRKEALKVIVAGATDAIRFSDHLIGEGKRFYDEVSKLGLEGVVSKRADSAYSGARTKDWVKTKCIHEQEFVIGGYTDYKGPSQGVGALLMGQFDKQGKFVFCGKVGTGFTEKRRIEIQKLLGADARDRSPFDLNTATIQKRGVHFVEPKQVAQVRYWEWTTDGILRHPVFLGLRQDKSAKEVRSDAPDLEPTPIAAPPKRVTHVEGIKISNPDRVMYPEHDIVKMDLIEYYKAVADQIMPLIEKRPVSLLRCPEGHRAECFFQKHADRRTFEHVHRVPIPEKDETREYFYVETLKELISLVQMGTLELHLWNARVDNVEKPDMMIFDLDPGPDVGWEYVVEIARRTRSFFEQLELQTFLKTSGGKGLHVIVPIKRRLEWDDIYAFTRAVAVTLVKTEPERLTANMAKSKRQGKIYLDYVRNSRGATSIAPYSTRARLGAPVAMPIGWDEVAKLKEPSQFNVRNAVEHIKRQKHDPWKDFLKTKQGLSQSVIKLLR